MMKSKSGKFDEAVCQYKKIIGLIDEHNKLFSSTINLVASENVFSQGIIRALSSDLNNRVAEGWIGERVYPGMQAYDSIEKLGIEVVRELFGYDHVDLRPISGTMANMAVYTALTEPGDTIMSLKIENGAHISMSGKIIRDVFKLNFIPIPIDVNNMSIDTIKTFDLIKNKKPKLIVLGGSVILFPQPIKEISEVAHSVGSIVLYDASHVAGLIAGGMFQNPSLEGADIVTFTTCKTIPGPQSAVILSRQEYAERLKGAVFPVLTSGHHLHETVGAILALIELKAFGQDYARKTIINAQTLGKELHNRDFKVLCKNSGFTASHTILLDCTELGGGSLVESKLESVNIIVNRNVLPLRGENFRNPSGIRIGTPEVSHLGMDKSDMVVIANFFERVLKGNEPIDKLKGEISYFRKQFQEVKYCFDNLLF